MKPVHRLTVVATVALVVLLAGAAPAFAKAADRNHDKIPDKWERKYHLSTRRNVAKQDPDKDGLSNLNEYLAGTNPKKKDSNHNGVRDGLEDRDKDGLVNLAEVAAHTKIRVADSDGNGVIDALEDPDQDALDNAEEWASGTNPLVADSNHNGINDGDEDADGDGLDNVQEFRAHTNPRMADSNHNGIPDGREDSDHDGVDNHHEFEDGTDPMNPDSDNDGVDDGQEIRGTIVSFDAATGLLTIASEFDASQVVVKVDENTSLQWADSGDNGDEQGDNGDGDVVDDGSGDVPGDVQVQCEPGTEATVEDLVPGTIVCDVNTQTQEDGSLLATLIVIAPADQVDEPDPPVVWATVGAWDPELSMLTVQPADDSAPYDVLVDEATQFCWADGATADHDASADDLVEGAGITEIDITDQDGGPQLATLIVLVPPATE